MREIVLDTETTGLDPNLGHRIVEIGCLELKNHIPTGEKFHVYVNPRRDMAEEAFKIHGLSTEFLKDHPPFVDIPDGVQPSALQAFNDARSNYEEGKFKQALELFEFARDLDGLKFRAPSQINKIIAEVAEEDGVNYVPVEENMAASIEDGIIGFELMLEHLHPNQLSV